MVAPYTCASGTLPPAPGSGSPVAGTLTYSATTGQYTYRYNTLRERAPNSCIQLSLPLADGTVRSVLFRFK